jgi:hypothetical protein
MFHRKKAKPPQDATPEPVRNPFEGLRRQALNASAELAGFSPAPEGRAVYGAVMDWGLDSGGIATLFGLADGTGSLYLSSGGGVIGGGFHEPVQQAVRAFIVSFEPFLDSMTADVAAELPTPGYTDLRALTIRGRLFIRATTDDFGKGRHPMSSVFHAGQAVISALRQVPAAGEMRPRS